MTAISKSTARRLRKPSVEKAASAGLTGAGAGAAAEALKKADAKAKTRTPASKEAQRSSREKAQAQDLSAKAALDAPAPTGFGVRPTSGLQDLNALSPDGRRAETLPPDDGVRYALNPGGDGPSNGGSIYEQRRADQEAQAEQDRRIHQGQWPETTPVATTPAESPAPPPPVGNPLTGKPLTAAADSVAKDPSPENVARQEQELRNLGVDPGTYLQAVAKKARLGQDPRADDEEFKKAGQELSQQTAQLQKQGVLTKNEGTFINRRAGIPADRLYAEDAKMEKAHQTLSKLKQLQDMQDYLKLVGGDSILNAQIREATKQINGSQGSPDDGLEEMIAHGQVDRASQKAADVEEKNLTGTLDGPNPAENVLKQDAAHWKNFETLSSLVKMLPGPYALAGVLMDSVRNAAKVDRGEMTNGQWWANLAIDTGMALGGKYLGKLTENLEGPAKQVGEALVDASKAAATEFGKEAARIWSDDKMSYPEKMEAINGAMRRSMAKAVTAMITGRAKAILKNATPEQKRQAVELLTKVAEKYGIEPQVKPVLDSITQSAEG